MFLDLFEAGLAGSGCGYFVTFVLEHSAQGFADLGLVVHDEDSVHYDFMFDPLAEVATGNSTTNRAPTGVFSSTRTEPWCSSTMRLTMASPNPVPRSLVEKYGKKSFSRKSLVTPCPVSLTLISTMSR